MIATTFVLPVYFVVDMMNVKVETDVHDLTMPNLQLTLKC